MRKLILVFVGCAMAFCLWPNQAVAVAGGYGGGRVESPSGGIPRMVSRQAVMDQKVMVIITRLGPATQRHWKA